MAIVLVLKLVFESDPWNTTNRWYFSTGYFQFPKDSDPLKLQKIAKYAAAKHNALIVPNEILPFFPKKKREIPA